MIMFDIAEWIINITVLGIGLAMWIIVLFGLLMLYELVKEKINRGV